MNTLKLTGLWLQLRALEATLYGQERLIVEMRPGKPSTRITLSVSTAAASGTKRGQVLN